MALICSLLASAGFVAAGYSETATADDAVARSPQNIQRVTDLYATSIDTAPALSALENFDPVAAGAVGVRMSFANILLQARKPTPERVFDLTKPNDLTDRNGNTPHLAQGVKAMRANVPEVSTDQMAQVRRNILTAAYMGLGHRYVWGGTSFSAGWDCSGFVQWAYGQAGIGLPRTEQWMPMVETNSPQPGDIVVQNPDGPNHWSHIGIYIGNGKMISALNPSVGTILHAPSQVSNSSTYFTMPAFAAADEKAAQDAKAAEASAKAGSDAEAKKLEEGKKTRSASPSPSPSMKPAAKPSDKPSTTKPASKPASKPATKPATKPGTTAPATKPATTEPTKKPATTPPVSMSPPATGQPPTSVPTTKPATTPPPATTPGTTPATTPTTKPPTTKPPTTTPTAVPTTRPATTTITAVPTTKPPTTRPPTTKPATSSPETTAAPAEGSPATPAATNTESAAAEWRTSDPTAAQTTAVPSQ